MACVGILSMLRNTSPTWPRAKMKSSQSIRGTKRGYDAQSWSKSRTWMTPQSSALEAGTRQLTTKSCSSSSKCTRPAPCGPAASALSNTMPTPHLPSTDQGADGSGDLRVSRFLLRNASSLEHQVKDEGASGGQKYYHARRETDHTYTKHAYSTSRSVVELNLLQSRCAAFPLSPMASCHA